MKIYCPKCGSYSVFVFWNKEKHQDWAVCRNCWHKDYADQFRIDYDDGYWQAADDRVHEWLIDNG
jgi:hypothetical protein